MNLDNLNLQQKKAVEKIDGPLLVLAGAGSGKTRVLTHKIAYLIDEKDIFPSNILAITFTNKASEEMKNRISALIGGGAIGIWMGTFHSICLRILRVHAKKIGYKNDFTIYDVTDQSKVIKNSMKTLNIDTKRLNPKHVRNVISMAKNELITPSKFKEMHQGEFQYQNYIKIYSLYQQTLVNNNAMDFDDLINNAIWILKENSDVLEYYQDKFKYILIDEYQDTNFSQYLFTALLSEKHKNICAVGDGDQSIYKFRGADIRNIYEFEKDYPQAEIIKLEQNYRSSQRILEAANSVIANNSSRKVKKLWTDNPLGDKIYYYSAYTEKDEANYVLSKIKQFKDTRYDDFAILYRTNAQSRSFEEVFIKEGIPYQMIGGTKFYERMEIKDVLAYLKLIQNPLDDIAFERIVNVPKRGIGKRSLEKLKDYSNKKGKNLYEGLLEIESCETLSSRAKNAFKSFRNIILNLRKSINELNVLEVFEKLINLSGYIEDLKMKGTLKDEARIDNVNELKSVMVEFVEKSDEPSLSNFLEETCLQAGIDQMDDSEPGVLMMTLHSAKGLEFKNVFLVGVEENLFPSYRSVESEEDLEEERRLCYVGITRAEKRLFISHSNQRLLFGQMNRNAPSRFIEEIDQELLQKDSKDIKNDSVLNNEINSDLYNDYKPGLKVIHDKFGEGTVIKSDSGVLTIAFDNQGIKKLKVDIAPIKIVG